MCTVIFYMKVCIMCERIYWLEISADNPREHFLGAWNHRSGWSPGSARQKHRASLRLCSLLTGGALTVFLAASAVARQQIAPTSARRRSSHK